MECKLHNFCTDHEWGGVIVRFCVVCDRTECYKCHASLGKKRVTYCQECAKTELKPR